MSESATGPSVATDPPPLLRDARETDRVGTYFRGLWRRRAYVWHVSTSELRSRQMDTALGNFWHLLNPALSIGTYFLIFGVVLGTDRGVDNYIGFLAAGVFMYGFTQRTTMLASRCLARGRGLIRIISFPRALLPITSTITEALAAIPTVFVLLIVVLLTGEPVSVKWLAIVPLFVLQTVFNAGVAMIAARAADHVADVQQLLPFIFRLGFYGSGVLFDAKTFVTSSSAQLLFDLNPLYAFVELYRWCVLDIGDFQFHLLVVSIVWTIGLFAAGFLWFRAGEEGYGND